ncbi:MAG: glucosamine-6-phosphate deaminase [Planctomycetota bacterium]
MNILIADNYERMSDRAAEVVSAALREDPQLVLGLATGGTPEGLYQRLVRRHREGKLDFSEVTTFNLDEYVGLPPEDPNSYHHYMRENLFDHVNLPAANTHLPDGESEELQRHCAEYENSIADAGGIDVQVLGIGGNCHLGFNEPGTSLRSGTHVATLTRRTVRDNAAEFENEADVPRYAVTMGLGTIMLAKRCVLLAAGERKAEPVRRAIEGPVTSMCPASVLQMHPSAVAILDEAAASGLERLDYYRRRERAWDELADRL